MTFLIKTRRNQQSQSLLPNCIQDIICLGDQQQALP